MFLFLIFLVIVIFLLLLLFARSSKSGRSRTGSSSRTIWSDQSTINSIATPPNPDWLNSNTAFPPSSDNNVADSNSLDSTASIGGSSWDSASSPDPGGGGDFGGFGGGGDFSGGGAGGDFGGGGGGDFGNS